MQCPNSCSFSMEQRQEDKIFRRNCEPIVISDLTIYVCPNCGQEAMPLASARIVEDILNRRVKPSGKFTAELYEVRAIG
jgi:YgiT-type zinc finger domain-containing protein